MKDCPSCQKKNEAFFIFCLSCGASLDGTQAESFAAIPLSDEGVGVDASTRADDVSAAPPEPVEEVSTEDVWDGAMVTEDLEGPARRLLRPITFDEFMTAGSETAFPVAPDQHLENLRRPAPKRRESVGPTATLPSPAVVMETDMDLPFLEHGAEGGSVPGHEEAASIPQRTKLVGGFPTAVDDDPAEREEATSPTLEAGRAAIEDQVYTPGDWVREKVATLRVNEGTVPDPSIRASKDTRAKEPPKRTRRSHGRLKKSQGRFHEGGHLVLIRDDGTDGDRFDLFSDSTWLGSKEADINFFDDDFMSSRHAILFFEGGELKVRSRDKQNGVFRRIEGPETLESGDECLVGQELLVYRASAELMAAPTASPDGTLPLGSHTSPGIWGYLYQRVSPTEDAHVFALSGEEVSVGRDANDINFPDDVTISGHHAILTHHQESATLLDLDSRNGTFIRLKDTTTLTPGEVLLVGRQLLRVEL